MSIDQTNKTYRRRHVRASVDFPVQISLPDSRGAIEGRAVDLGAGGMRVATAGDLPPGQPATLRFVLPGSHSSMMTRGRVVMSFFDAAKASYAHGIAFTEIAPEDKEAIASYVDGLLLRSSPINP